MEQQQSVQGELAIGDRVRSGSIEGNVTQHIGITVWIMDRRGDVTSHRYEDVHLIMRKDDWVELMLEKNSKPLED